MNAYNTSCARAVLALAAGAITGATLTTAWSFVGTTGFDEYWLSHAIFVFTYAAVVWGAGLLLIATGPWALLHSYRLRTWPVAVALGFCLSFLVVFGLMTNGLGAVSADGVSVADNGGPTWVNGQITRHGLVEAFEFAGMCSGIGMVVALTVWAVAYRQPGLRYGLQKFMSVGRTLSWPTWLARCGSSAQWANRAIQPLMPPRPVFHQFAAAAFVWPGEHGRKPGPNSLKIRRLFS